MTSSPLVSVLLPVYNGRPDHLEQAVSSVLGQAHGNLELLLGDDGSGPEVAFLLDGIARRDPRVRLFRHDNVGLTRTLLRLLGEVRGDFVARQDADDASEPDRFARQLAEFSARPNLMLLGTACLLVGPEGEPLLRDHVMTGAAAIREALPERNRFVHGSVMFRAGLFRSVSYREEFRTAQDYDLFLRIAERYEADNLDLPLYRHRIHPGGISASRMREQLLSAMVAREAARRRRIGDDRWSPGLHASIRASLEGGIGARALEGEVHAARGRNLLLFGRRGDAFREFKEGFLLRPGVREAWRMARCLGPLRRGIEGC